MSETMQETKSISAEAAVLPPLTQAQWLLLLIVAAVQFTHIVDFMLILPLATQLQADLDISIRQFGVIVSAYAFAAAAAGLALAPLVDRFDRKHALLTLYAGFTLGTLGCAVAPGYWSLVGARIVTGGFGGVAAATVLAIVGDAFPLERRGTATGVVMSAFSVASIAGVPAGLFLAQSFSFTENGADGWRIPFAVLGVASIGLLFSALKFMSSVRGHLATQRLHPSMWEVISRPGHVSAYILMSMLVLSTYTVFPFLAAYLVKNVGRSERDLQWVYLCGGLTTLLSMNVVGRLADRIPRLLLFRVLALLALVPIVVLTNLPAGTSLGLTLVVTTAMMVLTSGRMVPAMAMITSSAEARYRGSFLSINASVQQLAAGISPLLSTFIMRDETKNDPLVGYNLVGFVALAAGLATLVLAGFLRPVQEETPVLPPADRDGAISEASSLSIASAATPPGEVA